MKAVVGCEGNIKMMLQCCGQLQAPSRPAAPNFDRNASTHLCSLGRLLGRLQLSGQPLLLSLVRLHRSLQLGLQGEDQGA